MAFQRDDRRGGGDRGGGRSFGGGGRSFGGGGGYSRGGGDRGGFRERPEMHKAVCSNCGKDCEVPFRPTGAKPVFCSDCFRNQQGGSDRRDDRGPRNFERRDDRNDDRPRESNGPDLKSQILELNSKLDKIINLLGANSGSNSSLTSGETSNEAVTAPKKAKAPKKKAQAEEVILAPEVPAEAQAEEVTETSAEEAPTEA